MCRSTEFSSVMESRILHGCSCESLRPAVAPTPHRGPNARSKSAIRTGRVDCNLCWVELKYADWTKCDTPRCKWKFKQLQNPKEMSQIQNFMKSRRFVSLLRYTYIYCIPSTTGTRRMFTGAWCSPSDTSQSILRRPHCREYRPSTPHYCSNFFIFLLPRVGADRARSVSSNTVQCRLTAVRGGAYCNGHCQMLRENKPARKPCRWARPVVGIDGRIIL